jgi:hypothetical protein
MIPLYTPIQKGGNTYYSFLDKETMFSLYQYVYYSVFYEYVQAANNSELLYTSINERRQFQRLQNAELQNTSNSIGSASAFNSPLEEEDEDTGLFEIQIEIGNQTDLRIRVSELLSIFVKLQIKEKSITNLSYPEIYAKMRTSRDQEKKSITDFFKQMETDERKMENMKKILKLGRWNVGMQKGLVNYDETTYSRERAELLAQSGFEELNLFAPPIEEGEFEQDVEDLERDHRNLMEADESEGFDLGMLPEEYTDNYDETEIEREDDW